MANQLILGRALDANGFIMPGAKATVYADGTTTLIAVYADVDGTIPAANPIVADGNGMWPQRFVTEDAKVVVTNAANVPLYTLDPAPVAQGTGAAASAVSFAPSVDLPFTNVQTAIEGARAAALSGFAAFGLGITGNATLLANLDAVGTGAGVYRFDGTTTGTFPSGVAAADTGMVELWRQAGATAMMELHHATSNRVFRRRLTASAWGAWREVVNVGQGAAEGDLIYRTATDWARLPKGTAGQVLRMNAGATGPEWGQGSGRVVLATKTASASAQLDFTEFDNAVYRYYEFEFEALVPATTGVALHVRFSSNGGSTFAGGASDYSWGYMFGNSGGGNQGGALSSAVQASVDVTTAARGIGGTLKLRNAASNTIQTTCEYQTSGQRSGITSVSIAAGVGGLVAASETNAVRFLFTSGNIASGTIRMYGMI